MKLTRRGEIVFAVVLGIVALEILLGAWWLLDHINWVGDRYCFHSSIECFFPEGGSK